MGGPRAFCLNRLSYWSHAVIEDDGDSLLYEVLPPLVDSVNTLSWLSGFSSSNPLNVNGYQFDHRQRLMTFTPQSIQDIDRIRVKISEFRFDTTLFVWKKVGVINLDKEAFYSPFCSAGNPSLSFEVAGDTNTTIPGISCGTQLLDLNLSHDVWCNSVATDGSDFAIHRSSGNTVPIIGASTVSCGQKAFSNRIVLQLAFPVNSNDIYQVVSRIGRDGNTLISDCGIELPPHDSSLFYVYNCSGSVSQDENALHTPVSLYPNPFKDILQVKLNGVPGGRIIIYDQTGRILKDYLISESISTLNISDLKAGLYHLKFIGRGHEQSFKIRKI